MKGTVRFVASSWLLTVAVLAGKSKSKCSLEVPKELGFPKSLIAHRGASFNLPEHTLEAYRVALELRTDYVEVDLVPTSDSHLVAVHSLDLELTTNVDELFREDRKKPNTFDENKLGYWVHTFTLEEIKKLKVRQRLPEARSTTFDGLFSIPTLSEILELMHHWNTQTLPLLQGTDDKKRRAGLYVELKEPERLLQEANLDVVQLLLDQLKENEHASVMLKDDDCISLKYNEYLVPLLVVESFDGDALLKLHEEWGKLQESEIVGNTTDLPLVLLTDHVDCHVEDFWFKNEHDHLSGIGPDKSCLEGEAGVVFLTGAREHELAVHPWTVRPEATYFGESNLFNSSQEELRYYWCEKQGVDGLFVEDIASARDVRDLGCDDETAVVCPPTPAPLANDSQASCPTEEDFEEEKFHLGVAAVIMGTLVGTIITYWILSSDACQRVQRGRRELRIPTSDVEHMEMI